jgi:hypothetical protein
MNVKMSKIDGDENALKALEKIRTFSHEAKDHVWIEEEQGDSFMLGCSLYMLAFLRNRAEGPLGPVQLLHIARVMKFLFDVMDPTIRTALGMADTAMNKEGIGIEIGAQDLMFVGAVVASYFTFIARKGFLPVDMMDSVMLAQSSHHYINHLDDVFTEIHDGTLATAGAGDSVEVKRAIHEMNAGKAAKA